MLQAAYGLPIIYQMGNRPRIKCRYRYRNRLNQRQLSRGDDHIEKTESQGHIDDHHQSISTLANTLGQHGRSIEVGQKVITGAFGKTPFAEGVFQGHFSHDVGNVKVELIK